MAEKDGLQLIILGPETKDFNAGGKHFTVESTISADRYKFYLQESPKLAFGQTPEQIFKAFRDIFDITNDEGCRKGDIAVIARDAMKGIEMVVTRKEDPAVLRLCALFINEDGEDRRTISEDVINRKIEIWKNEGIDIASFFRLASASISGLKQLYEESSLLISQKPKGKKQRS